MSLKTRDFYNFLNQLAPLNIAEPQDNNGLQVGSFEDEVCGVLLVVDLTSKAIDYALGNQLNLIISHHPFIFKPLTQIIKEDPKGHLIYRLIQEKINLISWHTPLDKIEEGVSEAVIRALNLKGERFISLQEKNQKVFGLGRVVYLKKSIKLQDLAKKLGKVLKSWVMVVGDLETPIKAFGVCGGSGAFLKDELKNLGINTLITSDVKYHVAKDSLEEGFNFIVVDHGVAEGLVLDWLKTSLVKFITSYKLNLKIEIFREPSPYQILLAEENRCKKKFCD
ncbi:Nif3-like dinuclear metal center hexameric protein [Thermodesulfobacterium hveragerdense]|uniref:Nif3-like dinuclear metal center hexameric protein n=1 Tax=Thermodesulfobacterium hveragerdense TaxID=53424 RepID=UPI0003FD34C6|nr:Nif3-like dinuclear metal center hexameric protein [Thermodesulfobacterium hveragerdense]